MSDCKKRKEYEYVKEEIVTSDFIKSLILEIDYQTVPLFDLWEQDRPGEYRETFNPLRVVLPIIEMTSEIEFSDNVNLLLEKLNVPHPKIVWFMFRHGLMHSVRPFKVQYAGIVYNWGVVQSSSSVLNKHKVIDQKDNNKVVCISPRQLLSDLRKYLELVSINKYKITIQTGVRFNKTVL